MSKAPSQALFSVDKGGTVLGEDGEYLKHKKREQKRRQLLHEDKLLVASKVNNPKTYNAANKTARRHMRKLLERKKALEEAAATAAPAPAPAPAVQDLWAGQNEKLPKRLRRKAPTILKSTIAAVEPGLSYNPAFEDHQDVLGIALAEVTEVLDKDQALDERIREARENMRGVPAAMEVRLGEDESDDDDEAMEDEEDEELDDEQVKELVRKRHLERKFSTKITQTQRNKMKRVKLLHMQKMRSLARKRRAALLDKLPDLVEDAEQQVAELEERQKLRRELREERKSKIQRLGKYKYEKKAVDFLYTDELPENLRTLKPTGSVMDDIYHDLLQRNMVEPRKKVRLRPKRRVKVVEKRSSKNWREVT